MTLSLTGHSVHKRNANQTGHGVHKRNANQTGHGVHKRNANQTGHGVHKRNANQTTESMCQVFVHTVTIFSMLSRCNIRILIRKTHA